jgi:hypothetical protein
MLVGISLSTAAILKAGSVLFALLAMWPAMRARTLPDGSENDPDRNRRRYYLVSYFLTTISVLFFAAIGFV